MLDTTDVKPSGSGIPKSLVPGNQKITIVGVSYRDNPFKEGALEVILQCEGPQLENFEGFAIDQADPSKGNYKCQIGRVRSAQFAYADGETKSGIKIFRDMQIKQLLSNLCAELECPEWLPGQNNKHANIQSLLDAFNSEKPFAGKWLNVCLAGKEYTNKGGFTVHDLFFPKANNHKFAYQGEFRGQNAPVLEFNETDHIIKKKASETVANFEGQGTPEVDSDFQL